MSEVAELAEVQIIRDAAGSPQYAVLPYCVYERLLGSCEKTHVPHTIVDKMLDGASSARAWREQLGLSTAEVANRMNISQEAYAQLELSERLGPASRRKISRALGLEIEQIL